MRQKATQVVGYPLLTSFLLAPLNPQQFLYLQGLSLIPYSSINDQLSKDFTCLSPVHCNPFLVS
jgi:hypothetical protein